METRNNLPILFFADENQWHQWLAGHFDQHDGIWIKFAKKTSGIQSLNYEQALDGALRWGWIDTQVNTYDPDYYLQKFTPRRSRSIWSKRNVGKAEALIAAGKMQPAGQAAIDAAKADGRWQQAYDSSSNMDVPEDFQKALDEYPVAKDFFETLNKTNRYSFLWRIQTAKKPQTRQARIEKFIAMLSAGQKFR